MVFNGELVPGNVGAFYSFVYRARHRFSGPTLVGSADRAAPPGSFWRTFFRGAAVTPMPGDARSADGWRSGGGAAGRSLPL